MKARWQPRCIAPKRGLCYRYLPTNRAYRFTQVTFSTLLLPVSMAIVTPNIRPCVWKHSIIPTVLTILNGQVHGSKQGKNIAAIVYTSPLSRRYQSLINTYKSFSRVLFEKLSPVLSNLSTHKKNICRVLKNERMDIGRQLPSNVLPAHALS